MPNQLKRRCASDSVECHVIRPRQRTRPRLESSPERSPLRAQAQRRDAARRPPVAVGIQPVDPGKARTPPLYGGPRDVLGRHRAARGRPPRVRRRTRDRERDRAPPHEDLPVLRGAHAPERHPAHHRHPAEDRYQGASGAIHLFQPDPPVRRRLDGRQTGRCEREGDRIRAQERRPRDVRDRRHHAFATRNAGATLRLPPSTATSSACASPTPSGTRPRRVPKR